MKTHKFGDLHIDVHERPAGTLRLDWRGKSNLPQPENVLTPFLTDMTLAALAKKSLLEMHFETLDFFNSATITTIIKYIKQLPQNVSLAVFYTAKQPWQKIFFDALWVFERSNKLFKINEVTDGPSSVR